MDWTYVKQEHNSWQAIVINLSIKPIAMTGLQFSQAVGISQVADRTGNVFTFAINCSKEILLFLQISPVLFYSRQISVILLSAI